MGGLFYSQAFGGNISDNSAWTQVIEWHNFMCVCPSVLSVVQFLLLRKLISVDSVN